MRVLHFSDIHVGIPLNRVPWSRWLSKRVIGGLNLLLGRQRHFLAAREKVAALAEWARAQEVDLVVFSGDYTALGLEREFLDARRAVEPLTSVRYGLLNVPGNHDMYVRDVLRQGWFEKHFGDSLSTDLPEHRVDRFWPAVRLVGDDVAVVLVNSARPTPFWRASGRVPARQLEALQMLLRDERLRDRFLFVVTHYTPCLSEGQPDRRLHGLENVTDFISVCSGIERGALLCGHVHRCFHAHMPRFQLPVFCAGSATMDGHEGGWLFDLEDGRLRATAIRWKDESYELDSKRSIVV